MANRKAGSAGEGNTADAKRPAAGKQGAGGAAGGSDAGAQGGPADGRKRVEGARGPSSTSRGDSATAESTPSKGAGRSAAKGAGRGATKGGAKGGANTATTGGATKGGAKGGAKTATAGGAGSAARGAAKKGAGRGAGKPDLRGDLRRFIDENPHGWGHEQWQGLLGRLGERGHDTSDPDRIGMDLERERLSSRLEGVDGVTARHAKSIADRFGTLHGLRSAGADEIERHAKVPREVAERIKNRLG